MTACSLTWPITASPPKALYQNGGLQWQRPLSSNNGGNAMTDPHLKQRFCPRRGAAQTGRLNVVVVHKRRAANRTCSPQTVGKTANSIQGHARLDAETMKSSKWCFRQPKQRDDRSTSSTRPAVAVGLTGKDGSFIRAEETDDGDKGRTRWFIDINQVGDIIWTGLIALSRIRRLHPVIAPVGVGKKRRNYNINADVVASKTRRNPQGRKAGAFSPNPGVLDENGHCSPA